MAETETLPTAKTLALKYDRPVPRYTSYPTAPHFHGGIGPADQHAWLAQSDPERPISLYIHVPYCRQMCWYCGCHTKIVARYQPIEDFTAHLRREMALVAEAFGGRRRVAQLHWGGGTPNVLSPDDLSRLMGELRGLFDFDSDTEIDMELDPRGVGRDLLAALKDCGLGRASLGIQDFDPIVQRAINREQPFDLVRDVVDGLRGIGVGGINFDLIYGLPYQTRAGFAHSIEQALSLTPDRFAVFGYAHVPWMKKHQSQIVEEALPDAALRLELAENAARQIEAAGYRRIGLDHFAQATDPLTIALDRGTLRRNFQGYTTDGAETLVGLGPSAISATVQGYAQNAADIPLWSRAIAAGRLATQRGLALGAEDRWRGAAIERLMCLGALDLDALAADFDLPNAQFPAERARLAPLIADGIATLSGNMLRVTEAGLPLSRLVAAAFDTYLNAGPGRHSRAV
ncbi:oxygen-independent coproporphyrinogen III oxidase [Dongia sedimenti]|uniref:Coproporphyrinogen-III oxidase n=1 Tax=Dongia sedimenti TaxID=3064282 RepID=A0ABU0YP45_9PROT|nr:oxygen-independent coproporphyrinogen III oxidase [Rhodospirillaceae bacterium R-7]